MAYSAEQIDKGKLRSYIGKREKKNNKKAYHKKLRSAKDPRSVKFYGWCV